MNLFAKPFYLVYFVPTLLGILLVLWLGKQLKNRYVHALFGAGAYQKLTDSLRTVSAWRSVFFIGAVFFLFVALAGPQWGTEIVQTEGQFAQTVIAVDVSASMRAQDLSPDRLDNAKQMLQMLVNQLKDDRIGIIAFTSQAFIQCPITTDTEALESFIARLQPDMLPVPGTSLAAPVLLSARMLAKYPGKKALILLTDGEDHSPQELQTAKQAAQQHNIRVIAIGIGTPEGAILPDKVDASGKVLEYKKDKEGKTVVSKLDEKTLVELAKATEGAYIAYSSPARVAHETENALKGLDRSTAKTAAHKVYKNRYAFPLGLAIVCLAVYLFWPRGRKKETSKKVQ